MEDERALQVGSEVQLRYVGLATRVVAFVIDAALITLVAFIVEVAGGLILSVLHIPSDLRTLLLAIGGALYVLWSVGYFVAFWSSMTGQTPGARVMQIRVVAPDGGKVKPRRALVRCVGVLLAALPLFAGFVLILFDDKRRGFQDRFARTLVVESPEMSIFQQARARRRAARETSRQPPPALPG
jgi:uncharacterized RDD family membrane protein YckC